LDAFLDVSTDRYLPLTVEALRKAAELWANVRNAGLPTAGKEALDGDVILAAQLLTSKFVTGNLVVATSNAKHIARFLAAREWRSI
jgi:predicted nucleic acid-binding protein